MKQLKQRSITTGEKILDAMQMQIAESCVALFGDGRGNSGGRRGQRESAVVRSNGG